MDDPNRAPEEEVLYQPLPDGAPKDARQKQVKEYLRNNYVGSKSNSEEEDFFKCLL